MHLNLIRYMRKINFQLDTYSNNGYRIKLLVKFDLYYLDI